MQLLGGLGALAVLVVSAWIGGRMLLRRQGLASPETLLGASLFLGGVFALPLSVAGAEPRLADDLRVTLGLGGQLATFAMTVCQAAFVWVVFRRNALWAKLLVAAIGLGFASLLVAQALGGGLAEYFIEQAGILRWNLLALQVMYLWASVEPLRYSARMRRQLRIGLGDASAARRMLQWGLANSCSFVSNGGIIATTLVLGLNPLQSPALLGWIGVLALASSCFLWLAFLAPSDVARRLWPAEEEPC